MGESNSKVEFDNILSKLSPRERIYSEIEAQKIIDNVIGFIPASNGCETSILSTNFAVALAKKGFHVCMLDCKVFYPNLYQLLDCEARPKEKGLIKLLRSDKVDFRDEIDVTKYKNLFLLSPSPMDSIEDYFDFRFDDLERIVMNLKDMFDFVVLDVPNIPALEFCIGAVKYCNTGFFVWSERIECAHNMSRFMNFISSLGISAVKIANVIINNVQGFNFDKEVISEMGVKLIAEFPYVPKTIDCSLEGKVYINDCFVLDKRYEKALNRLVEIVSK